MCEKEAAIAAVASLTRDSEIFTDNGLIYEYYQSLLEFQVNS
ncbi:MAG: hypothetical protein ACI9R3_003615 [Verrucomicrobiales bacterium]|jgi:hypothetical protein